MMMIMAAGRADLQLNGGLQTMVRRNAERCTLNPASIELETFKIRGLSSKI
jgi:hypothetical protein